LWEIGPGKSLSLKDRGRRLEKDQDWRGDRVGSFSPPGSRVSRSPGSCCGSLGPTPRALSRLLAPGAGSNQHTERRATAATGLHRTPPVFFFFWGEGAEDPLPVLLGPTPFLFSCVGGQRGRGGPRQCGPRGGAGTSGTETGTATFLDPDGRSREAQRSGFSPWKRSFCSSGSDRNGTVSCRGHRARWKPCADHFGLLSRPANEDPQFQRLDWHRPELLPGRQFKTKLSLRA